VKFGSAFLVESGDIAQLGERRLCKPEVTGSIPVISTIKESLLAASRGAA
jgi:hypothetical protein